MPQVPSPNMQIIWPTDGDDANAWAPIMDTAIRVTIDGHNHSPSSGAQISIGSLKFDTDISFVDSLGGKHAITNLKTISFFPSPPPVGINGSFFIGDGTSGTVLNELYFRTMLGANVQVSNGATLNVGAFAGTIGGDYVGVAALESFIDAADAYLFQQQVGTGGVRQFAKMQCADLQLFEFKSTVAGPPVPTQAVTLKSPAALAAGYALTMPAALPVGGTAAELYVDSAGNVSAGTLQTIQLPTGANATTNTQWNAGFSAGPITIPIPLRNGDRIRAVRARIQDNATGPTKLTVGLQSWVDGTPSTIATSAQSAGTGANQTISASGLTTTIASGTNYSAVVNVATGASTCKLFWIEVDYDRP